MTMTQPSRTTPTRRAEKAAKPAKPAKPRKPPRPARAPRPPLTGTPAVTSSAATMLAVVCLWVFVQLLLLGDLKHERAQDLLYA
ncbi:hypothetical protein, partial [Nocardioides sp. REDSEA-S30_B4]|uniref:hypothetical protein n=1 Tax=Nocardioides sp. REDSEA-S30_B4 TaxID=1811552 RepID=UPI0025EFB286